MLLPILLKRLALKQFGKSLPKNEVRVIGEQISRLEGFMNASSGYEKKFASFIQICSEANAKGTREVTIASPSAIGDNYEELTESLSRLADAGLRLHIAARKPVDIYRNDETGSD